jgi:hypothetical protein
VSAGPVVADTFAGRIHVEWDNSAPVTPFGQMSAPQDVTPFGSRARGWQCGVVRSPRRLHLRREYMAERGAIPRNNRLARTRLGGATSKSALREP